MNSGGAGTGSIEPENGVTVSDQGAGASCRVEDRRGVRRPTLSSGRCDGQIVIDYGPADVGAAQLELAHMAATWYRRDVTHCM